MVGNSSFSGGGAYNSTLNNCIAHNNSAFDGNYSFFCSLHYCCTTPLPSSGAGNFTDAPLFVNESDGDLRLQSQSPCINAGLNAYAPGLTDLAGGLRIAGGLVDVGAFEFQAPTSQLPYVWLQQYGLPTDGSADLADPDLDGLNDWNEWIAGTNPTNAASKLEIVSVTRSASGAVLEWTSVSSRTYWVEGTVDPVSGSYSVLATNLAGQAGTATYTDTHSPASVNRFYRVGVAQ